MDGFDAACYDPVNANGMDLATVGEPGRQVLVEDQVADADPVDQLDLEIGIRIEDSGIGLADSPVAIELGRPVEAKEPDRARAIGHEALDIAACHRLDMPV